MLKLLLALYLLSAAYSQTRATSSEFVSDSRRLLEVVRNETWAVIDCVAHGDGEAEMEGHGAGIGDVTSVSPAAFSRRLAACQDLLHINGLTVADVLETRGRQKRSILKGIYPDTKWCGLGNVADHEQDLSTSLPATDACCRGHDLQTSCCSSDDLPGINKCPVSHTALSKKYGRFNWAPYTKSYCVCDEEFNRCLENNIRRGVEVEDSRRIAELFFNTIAPRCLHVKKQTKVCVEKGFWLSACKKFETKTTIEEKACYLKFEL